MDISIIIPALNEESRLIPTLKTVCEYMKRKQTAFEIIVVDDGSTDDTSGVVTFYARLYPEVRLIKLPKNHGKGFAVKTGMLAARGRWKWFMDADNSTSIEEMEKLAPFQSEYDIIIGSRSLSENGDAPRLRILLGRAANLLIRVIGIWNISDTQCGFKCFRDTAADKLFATQKIDGWGFDFEILALAKKIGYAIREVPVVWHHHPSSRVRPLFAAFYTLVELIRVRFYLWMNRYPKLRP